MDLVAPSANERSDQRVGTRFWIFPQAPFIHGYEKPDRVWLPILPDEVWDGPSDIAMYVADPLFDKQPYGTAFVASVRRCAPRAAAGWTGSELR